MSFTEDRDVFFTSKLNKFIAPSQSCILFIFTSEITKKRLQKSRKSSLKHICRGWNHTVITQLPVC